MTANEETSAKPAPLKRRKRRKRKPRDEPICYLIRVTDWDCYYGFRVSDPKSHLLYLPLYSPDLNPIEKAFSKLKALLRTAATRTIPEL
jgi:hypothetical protein